MKVLSLLILKYNIAIKIDGIRSNVNKGADILSRATVYDFNNNHPLFKRWLNNNMNIIPAKYPNKCSKIFKKYVKSFIDSKKYNSELSKHVIDHINEFCVFEKH